jgi:plasmid stabilization system protein ParE
MLSATAVVKAITSCFTSLLDFENAGGIEAGMRPQRARRFRRHHAHFRQRLGGRQLHFQPLLELVLVVQMRPISGRV